MKAEKSNSSNSRQIIRGVTRQRSMMTLGVGSLSSVAVLSLSSHTLLILMMFRTIMVVTAVLGVLELASQEAIGFFFHQSPTTMTHSRRKNQNDIRQQVLWSDCSSNPNNKRNNYDESSNDCSGYDDDCQEEQEDQQDTIRVRIWQALANGQEVSLAQSSFQLGLPRSEIRHHLNHVKKQAKTFGNKSIEWRIRRGLEVKVDDSEDQQQPILKKNIKMRLEERRGNGKRREIFVRLRHG